jgi:vitamin B12 transporter
MVPAEGGYYDKSHSPRKFMMKELCMINKSVVFTAIIFIALGVFLRAADGSGSENEETMFTEEVEVLGNVPVVKTIQSVSIFKKEEIETFNFDSLKAVLKMTPGLLTLSTGQFGQASTTYIRGSKSTQVLFIVDGVKLRDGASIGGLSIGALPPGLLDRVEVVRGPLSSIYGSDAMGGVVSMNTVNETGGDLLFSIGSHGSYNGNLSGTLSPLKNLTLGVSVNNRRYSDDVENDVFKNTGVSAKLNYKNDVMEAGLRFFGNFTDSGIPFNYGAATPERKYQRRYTILALPFIYRFSKDAALDIKLAYTNSLYKFDDPQDLWEPYFKSNFDNYEAEVTYNGRFFEKLDVRVGMDYSDQKILNENTYSRTLDNEKMSYFSTFASTELNLDALQVSASIRYDKYKDVDANVSPQVGISYLLANKLKLRAAYSHSFLAPLVSQMVNPWGESNFNLKPEKGKSYEVGAEFYSAPFTFSVTYFNTKYEDMIDWVTTDWVTFSGQYQNFKNVDTYGIELAATMQPLDNFTLSGAYTYLHTEDRATGEPLIRKPRHTLSGSAAYAHKRFTLSVSMIYVGKRMDYDYSAWPPEMENPAFNSFDFNLMVPVTRGLTVFGKLTNAFDRDYQEFIGYPAPGRRFEVGFKYKMK